MPVEMYYVMVRNQKMDGYSIEGPFESKQKALDRVREVGILDCRVIRGTELCIEIALEEPKA